MDGIIVVKRDGSEEFFDASKVAESIFGAAMSVGGEDMDLADDLAYKVLDLLESNDIQEIGSDDLQRLVEDTLINEGHATTARQYILKGADRKRIRELDTSLIKSFEELTFQSEAESNIKRENANIDSSTSMGTMLKYGSESAKSYNLSYMISEDIAEAHKNCDIHIHDLDFYTLTATCDQIPLDRLFKGGFNTGHGFLREPGNIRTAAALTAIALQSNQNDQHGGQSIPMLDHYLSPYVALSYIGNIARECKSKFDLQQADRKELKSRLKVLWQKHKHLMNEQCNRMIKREVRKFLDEREVDYSEKNIESILKNSYDDTYDDTFQAMEGLIHNLNTMHCLPASEKIWVFDVKLNKFYSITMEQLNKNFETNRFKAISLNKDTGKAELKFITHCECKGNHRVIVKITDNQGRTVRVTDNHRVMTLDGLNITEKFPNDCDCILTPRGLDVSYGDDIISLPDYDTWSKEMVRDWVGIDERLIETKEGQKFMYVLDVDIAKRETSNSGEEYVYDISVEDNENFLTYECIYVHNSRAGAQVPFSSVNYGTDTTTEGRIIQETILKTTWDGLGNGETPIFPIQILKLKKGINVEPEDPFYDIFELACKVSAKRFYPNFENLDAPYNAELYVEGHPETEMATMGCRTRIGKNVYDPTNSVIPGRGNLSFTSINLPRLGIKANKDIDTFYRLLDVEMKLVHRQLLERLNVISKRKPLNYPFLMGQACWLGSENLGPTDSLKDIWKHGTLTVGFIGLAETLVALTGKHHGESDEAQKLGLEIIGHMRQLTDKWAEEEHLNYSLLGTPAEGLSGRFVRADKKLFGIIPGVTDRDYYTNSSHVPVYYPISAKKKIDIEAPYHALENGGHILYIEMDGDPTKNLKAFMKVVKYMYEKNAGYFAVNHPVDRDSVCGYVGVIDDVCPRCGRREGEPMTMEMWNKIKGFANAGNADTLGYHGDINEENDRTLNSLEGISE